MRSGRFASLGHNLIGETDGSSGWVGSDLTGTIAHPLNADAGTLAQLRRTDRRPWPCCPAVRPSTRGTTPSIPAGVTTDQRGFAASSTASSTLARSRSRPRRWWLTQPPTAVHHRARSTCAGGRPGQYPERRPDDHVRPDRLRHPRDDHSDYGQLELSNTTGLETITGPAAGVTVSGDGLSRVFEVIPAW